MQRSLPGTSQLLQLNSNDFGRVPIVLTVKDWKVDGPIQQCWKDVRSGVNCFSILNHTMVKSKRTCGDWIRLNSSTALANWKLGSWLIGGAWTSSNNDPWFQQDQSKSRMIRLYTIRKYHVNIRNFIKLNHSPLISILITASEAHSCTKPHNMHIVAPSAASQLPKRFVDSWSCRRNTHGELRQENWRHPKNDMIPDDYEITWDHTR